MYHIQLTNIGEHAENRVINAAVDTIIEAESAACREAGKIVGHGTGYLCHIGHGNYLIRVGQFIKGTVKIKEAKSKPDRGGKE